MRSNYVVEVTVKEVAGDYTPKVDKFKGSPEKVVGFIPTMAYLVCGLLCQPFSQCVCGARP